MRALLMKSKGGGAPITTAGIYWNSKEGIISLSSDGTNWTTIADKNLGATQVYNDGDTLSEANCGKFYQRGNNYGFSFTGVVPTSNNQVNAQNYGPGNYYSSSTFIYRTASPYGWESSGNMNLWGGVTGTNEAMQGPCTTGFHVPNENDLSNLKQVMEALTITLGNKWKEYLKIPSSGYLQGNGNKIDDDFYGWKSIRRSDNINFAYIFIIGDTGYNVGNITNGISYGQSIRPFKNTPVQPDDGGDWETLYTPPEILNFTANTAGSTIKLQKYGSPTAVTLETSTDGNTWNTYTFGDTITLSNVGDKVYWRNTSTTDTGFSIGPDGFYQFVMTGSISASGDVMYLLNKKGTSTITGNGCFYGLFMSCTSLILPPVISATTATVQCLRNMFNGCSNLEGLPKLLALNLNTRSYYNMFRNCTKIKLSTTQTGEYQTPYRIPTTGTGTIGTNSLQDMFTLTGGTFTGTPTINTTYYTSNTVI